MGALFWVRFGFVLLSLIAVGVCVWKYERTLAVLKTFFCEPGPALNLGLLRIFVFALLLDNALSSQAAWYTSLDESFINIPRGWVWLRDFMPFSPKLVRGLEGVLVVTMLCATLGLATRVATIVSSLLAVIVFGIPNLYFKINHGLHVPVLTALLIAASPAGDALSLDALIRRFRKVAPPAEHVAYTLPVRFAWLLAGTMYLFPGLWKLWETGDWWIDGTKLRVELFDKWGQLPDFYPPFRADQMPWLMALLGTMTLIVEIGFLPAMFHRVTRVLAGLSATGFHLGVGYTMQIWFNPWYPLLVLFDLPKLLQLPGLGFLSRFGQRLFARVPERARHWLTREGVTRELRPRLGYSVAATWAVGFTLMLSMFVAGLGPVDSWPIAVYPRFSTRDDSPPLKSFSLRFAVRGLNGDIRDLPSAFDKMGDAASVFRIARATLKLKNKKRESAALDRHVELLTRIARENFGPFQPGEQLLIYRHDFKIDPDERRAEEPKLTLAFECDL